MDTTPMDWPDNGEAGFSGEEGDVCEIRLLREDDLAAIAAMERARSGHDRSAYYKERIANCIREPGINTSLVAVADGKPAGFLMGKVFFGEFGIPATRAVLDALGTLPEYRGRGIARGLLSQYRKNLAALRVEAIDTLVDWDRPDLLGFFREMGFRPSRMVDLVWDVAKYPFGGVEGEVRVRPAEPEDMKAVAEIDQESGVAPRRGYLSVKLGSARENPGKNLFIVAELEGHVAGYLVGSLFRGEFGIDEARGVVDSFAVRAPFRHRGVASAMLAALLELPESQGVSQLETLCRWNDWELLQFFEYAGFRPAPRFNLELRLA